MLQYSVIDINSIKENINEYCLDNKIVDSINELVGLLNLHNNRQKTPRRDKQLTDDNGKWAKKEIFKTTKIEKREGIEEKLDNYRGILNKIVSNNYDEKKEKIMESISSIVDESECEEVYEKVIQCFFVVIINNNIYSNLYAKLYASMMEQYVKFEENSYTFLEKYNKSFENIRYADPDEDYDNYCIINKENHQRKALLKFIVNSVDMEIYSFNEVMSIINVLFERLNDNLQVKENKYINEEIIENIFIVLQEGKDLIMKEVYKYDIIEKIKYYSALKVSDYQGFTSRMKFKMMDLLDLYK